MAAVLIGVLLAFIRFSEYRRRSDENGALPSGGALRRRLREIARSIDGRVGLIIQAKPERVHPDALTKVIRHAQVYATRAHVCMYV